MEKNTAAIKPESWIVSAGRPSKSGAPLNVPLTPASNFILGSGRDYSRDDGTPTWEALEDVVGGLESGKAVAFASGMAAIASVFDHPDAGRDPGPVQRIGPEPTHLAERYDLHPRVAEPRQADDGSVGVSGKAPPAMDRRDYLPAVLRRSPAPDVPIRRDPLARAHAYRALAGAAAAPAMHCW